MVLWLGVIKCINPFNQVFTNYAMDDVIGLLICIFKRLMQVFETNVYIITLSML